jgi:Polysaccharide lyase family 8, N terminal alpha-helical domain/Polysaccharide lyase family 8, super-sandwich domain/Polysaccharide lyase family 8, C-terminal beta-sandwich domain
VDRGDQGGSAHARRISRRQLLIGGAALGGLVVAGGAVALGSAPLAHASDEYDVLRARWAGLVTGGAIDSGDPAYATVLARLNSSAQQWRASLDTSSGRSVLWSDLPLGSAFPSANVVDCYTRLRTLAVCWATPGGVYHGDASLAADVVAALDFLHTKVYNTGQAEYDNWWSWEIGAPQRLEDICALLYAQLGSARLANYLAAIDHFVPSPTMYPDPGTNRVDSARVVALRGVLGKSAGKIAAARDSLTDSLRYVLTGDGLYRDGSYVYHTNVAYTGTYGIIHLDGVAQLVALLAGSSWPVTDPNMANLYNAVSRSVAPVVYRGLMTDTVRGRAISRSSEPDVADGLSASLAALRLALSAPAAQAAQLRSLAKGWLLANTLRPIATYGGVNGLALAKPVLDDPSIPAAAEPVGHSLLADMDRAVHRRPGWAYSLSLSSARIARYEAANGENTRGWHTGDGMGLLHLDSDAAQYNDAFWPTVNPKRLPGITVDTGTLAAGVGQRGYTPATWVGGAVLGGQYAAVGMDLRGLNVTLSARKSWYCLDDCAVALGAGITSSDGRTVETVVENRNLHDPAKAAGTTLTVDGTAQPDAVGSSRSFAGAGWAHLDGTGGYLFLGGATLRTLREDRTGSWHDVNAGGSTTPVTRRYLTMWLDHGVSPSGAGYAYVLLPRFSAAATAERAASPGVEVLANSTLVQAVRHAGLGLTAANFFTAGTVDGITVDAPCSVVLRESGGTLSVAVADPRRAVKTVTVKIARGGHVAATPGPGVSVLSVGSGGITLLAEVGGAHGATRGATLQTSGQALAAGAAALLAPAADAYVRDGSYASQNFGADTSLVVKRTGTVDNSYNRIAYLRFDLSGVSRPVERAVLWVYGATADSGGTQTGLRTWRVDSDTWTESGLTWSNRPTLVGGALSGGEISTRADWIGFDVTSAVAAAAPAAGGDGRASLAIWQAQEAAPGLAVVLHSRQNTSNPPRLQVVTR